jgi:prolyl oligopeptidase
MSGKIKYSQYPKTKIDTVTDNWHGNKINDDFRWLEDQESKETRLWIDEQMKHTKSVLSDYCQLDIIESRLKELSDIEQQRIPITRSNKQYFMKKQVGENLFHIWMKDLETGVEKKIVDASSLSEDETMSIQIGEISKDGRLMIYLTRDGGADENAMIFFDLETLKETGYTLPETRFSSFCLTNDCKYLWYSMHDKETGPRLCVQDLSKPFEKHNVVFGDQYDMEKIIGCDLSESNDQIIVSVYHGCSSRVEQWHAFLNTDKPEFKEVTAGIDSKFHGFFAGDDLFVQTDYNAPNWKILKIDLEQHPDEWEVVISEKDYPMETVTAACSHIFCNYLKDVNTQIHQYTISGELVRQVELPGLGSTSHIVGKWNSDQAFYVFTSFNYSNSVFEYSPSTGVSSLWSKAEVPFNADEFEVNQVWYESKDSTKVPMFLFHKKGLKKDGQRPVFLTGYGGFNVSLTPVFSALSTFWAEKDGVYAMPALRGGGEFGQNWHEAGMKEKKQNVFDDFHAAAEWLIDNGYSSKGKISISGGSNGGLLMGAAITQRPDLYKAALCSYPLLDMLRFQNFLVGRFWVGEYGCAENEEDFHYIKDYSPYHQVDESVKYPAIMFISGDLDTRVDPLHARKMAALMQTKVKDDSNPYLLHYDTKAGHVPGMPLDITVRNMAEKLGFLYWQLDEEL